MNDNTLKSGSLLKHGEYRIERTLGQGGFGITYEAEQTSLGRKVAVKEFFMKEHCNRDEATSQVSVPSVGSKELVEKFRQKFIREAKMIAGLDHEHIVKIHDVFEENGTAYYVMEYLGGGCLGDGVKAGKALPEQEALNNIRQIASALEYLHKKGIIHFDVKPSNVLRTEDGKLKLIDFGISKHYDEDGVQTSSTPVGISKGYAPLEQYKQGSDLKSFTPATDIYALGATLYALLAGANPPEASDVNDDGLPVIYSVSPKVMRAVEKAMQPRRKDRPQSVSGFLKLLDSPETDEEETVVTVSASDTKETKTDKEQQSSLKPGNAQKSGEKKPKSIPKWLYGVAAGIAVAVLAAIMIPKFISHTGKIAFDSNPQGAEVWLDGDDSGSRTPCILSDIPYGTHSVTYRLDGYCEYNDSIMVLDRKTIYYTGTLESHECIDLGLSVKWATCNIGALRPEDYGYYFAWGETSPKSNYSWSTLKYCSRVDDKDYAKFSKYVVSRKYGTVDNKKVLELSDDAAHINWGGNWRMPTDSEFEELENKCTWSRTKSNGVNGFEVKSKINGKSIFLPYAGEYRETSLVDAAAKGHYWSSSLPVNFACSYACGIVFYPSFRTSIVAHRFVGKPVRPVCPI